MGLLPRDEEAGNLEPFCRICLGGDDEDDCGRLMTPCNCTGSLRHVHKKCFETWTKNCPPLPDSGTVVGAIPRLLAHAGYYWLCTRIRCELCGSIYRVKRIRLRWVLRWMFLLLISCAFVIGLGRMSGEGPRIICFKAQYQWWMFCFDSSEEVLIHRSLLIS
mmetsp:Transcript_16798/g.24168  ORF Transcript_16798/g.24168 Transcript_16798/m.24168 type:complete len:162 (+) Transcript_16798:262-747(+)